MQTLLKESGTPDTGVTRFYVKVLKNEVPKGSLTAYFTTTYSKAKTPDEHHTRFQLHFDSLEEIKTLADFLSTIS